MANDPAASVTQLDAIKAVVRAHLRELHTTIPGVVRKYDPATQRADIQPVVRTPVTNEDGEEVMDEHPVIPNVPVRFPCAGGFVIIMPLDVGDHVDLHFCEEDPAGWRTTGQVSDPLMLDRHGMYAYATLGARADANVIPAGADTGPTTAELLTPKRLVIGQADGDLQIRCDDEFIELGKAAPDFVALASLVDARLTAIEAYLETIKTWAGPTGHSHAGGGSGAPTSGLGDVPDLASVASAVVKCT